MKELFIPYEQALALKELGFDEPCIARYNVPGDLITTGCYTDSHITHLIVEQSDICESHVLTPLWQQAFRWLYQKLSIKNGTMPLDTESQQLLLKELIDKVSSKHLLV